MKHHQQPPFQIDQCLHGYQRGHTLIAASRDLPKSAQSLIGRRSDSPYSGYTQGQPSVLCGYPVPDLSAYALARTWPAPEMSRPGCVWTHTLLIDYSLLAKLHNPKSLLRFLRHPPREGPFDFYETKLALDDSSFFAREPEAAPIDMVESVLRELYELPHRTAYIAWNENAESCAMAIWAQQCPKLRRAFKFQTLGSKQVESTDFDLVFFRSRGALSIDHGSQLSSSHWLDSAVQDVARPETTTLRAFFTKYGPECVTPRAAFKPFTELWTVMRDGFSTEDEARRGWLLAERWAQCPEGIYLELLVRTLNATVSFKSADIALHVFRHIDILEEIELDSKQLKKLGSIAVFLPKLDLSQFLRNSREWFKPIIADVFAVLPKEDLIYVAGSDHDLINRALQVRSELIYDANWWSSHDVVYPSVHFVTSEKTQTFDMHKCVEAMFSASAIEGIEYTLSNHNRNMYVPVLELLSSKPTWLREYGDRLLGSLHSQADRVLEALLEVQIVSDRVLDLLAQYIRVEQKNPSGLLDPWLVAIHKMGTDITRLSPRLATYMFCRGISRVSPQSEKLLIKTFDHLYGLLAESKLELTLWRKIDEMLPSSTSFFEWDRCDRLCTGTARHLVLIEAGLDVVLGISSRAYPRRKILKTICRREDGRAHISGLLESGDHKLSDSELIHELLKKNR